MNSEAILTVAAAVVALTQLVKWAGTPDRYGPIVVLLLAAVGVGIWKADNPAGEITWFSLFAGLISVATSAAGVFGFTRASAEAITKTSITTAGRGFMILLLASGSIGLSACTARQGHAIATVDDVAHDGLARFDDLLDASCDAERLNADTCKAVNKLLAPTWHAYVTANRAARAGDVSKIAEFRRAVEVLIAEVRKLVSGDLLQLLLPELELAKTQVGR